MESGKTLGYFLAGGLRIFKFRMNSRFREEGIELTFDQFVILQILHSGPEMIQQELANRLQKDKSVIVRQVNGLLKKDLIERHPAGADRRKKNLTLTKKGETTLNQMQKIGSEVTQYLLSGVAPANFDAFVAVLEKIQENGKAARDEYGSTLVCRQK
jgi:DNA-binding MarR family transcriptional regulator